MGLDIGNNGGHALAAFLDFVTLTSRLYAPARARTAPAQSIPLSPLTTRRRGRRSPTASNSRRSASDKVIATAALPSSHPSNTTDELILINFSITTLV